MSYWVEVSLPLSTRLAAIPPGALIWRWQVYGNPPANETSRKAAVILSDQFDERGRFLPRTRGEGEIKLAGGSLQLLGLIRDKGKELDGAWFLDGVEGGGFRITPKGYLFP